VSVEVSARFGLKAPVPCVLPVADDINASVRFLLFKLPACTVVNNVFVFPVADVDVLFDEIFVR
jgi:hypothetical protein